MNKVDRLEAAQFDPEALRRRLIGGGHHGVRSAAVSALTGTVIGELLADIDDALPLDQVVRATFLVHAGDGATLAQLHQFGRVLATRYSGDQCEVDAEVPESLKRRLERRG